MLRLNTAFKILQIVVEVQNKLKISKERHTSDESCLCKNLGLYKYELF